MTSFPFRIAPLPYRPLPQPGAPLAPGRTHTVVIARDGTDAAAPGPAAGGAGGAYGAGPADGRPTASLALGGAILDAPERPHGRLRRRHRA